MPELQEKGAGLKARWQAEKETITRLGRIKADIEAARHAKKENPWMERRAEVYAPIA